MGSLETRSGTKRIRLGLHDRPAVLADGRTPFVLSGLLAVVAAGAAAASLFFPGLIGGTAVVRGNLRGTCLVVLAVGVPLLVGSTIRAAQGSARALVLWLGALAYLLYQGVLLNFMTPYNNLFLLYVAMLGLALWSVVAVLGHVELPGFAARVHHAMPVRGVAAVAIVLGVLNAVLWLVRIVPTVFSGEPASVLHGSGLMTNAVWVQDLAFWIPATVVMALRMWRRRSWGSLLTAALLVFFAVEGISVAVDQWWGVRADASQPDIASLAVVPIMVMASVAAAAPLVWYFRYLDRRL